MKKILLTILCFAMTFLSFSQNTINKKTETRITSEKNVTLKKNSVQIVEYISKNLKLNSEQKAICMNAYAEYANNMMKAEPKILSKVKKDSQDSKKDKKEFSMLMLRFSEKRDQMIKSSLKKKQVKLYDFLLMQINPFTLELRKEKKEQRKKGKL